MLLLLALSAGAGELGPATADTPMVLVPVATEAVERGAQLEAEQIQQQLWPTSLLPDDVLDELPEHGVSLRDLAAGEPLRAATVASHGPADASLLIPRGMRLFVRRPPDPALIRPGDYVDVVAGSPPCTIGQAIFVLGSPETDSEDHALLVPGQFVPHWLSHMGTPSWRETLRNPADIAWSEGGVCR